MQRHGAERRSGLVTIDDVLLAPQEEVATFYAVMIETDYAKKPVFNKNFWEGFKQVLALLLFTVSAYVSCFLTKQTVVE